jgi:hypothetical protein
VLPRNPNLVGKGSGRIGLDSCKLIIYRCAVAIEAFMPKNLVDMAHVLSLSTPVSDIAARTGVQSDVSTPFTPYVQGSHGNET